MIEEQAENRIFAEVSGLPNQEMNRRESRGRNLDVQRVEDLRQEPARNRAAIGSRGEQAHVACPSKRDDPHQNGAGLQIDGICLVSQASSWVLPW